MKQTIERTSVLIVVALTTTLAQPRALKIVVIQGEDAVNVIQQKTAVAPIVEVRDQNDLPVAGVPVTFTIAGQNAAFGGGLQTVSLTTNAAGRAAVASLNPLGSGAVQINVSASFQGQTITASISQTNFATAAAAAQAGAAVGGAAAGAAATGAAVGAGAGATGGGLGAVAIGAIAGGVGAGVLVATKAAGGGDGGTDGNGSANCTLTVSPTSFDVTPDGGTRTVNVLAPGSCNSSAWTASSNMDWVTVNPTSGSGTGAVTLSIAQNQPRNTPRSGNISVAGQPVNVAQARGCDFVVSPTTLTFPGSGGSLVVNISLDPPGCTPAPWTAQNGQFLGPTFITINPLSGTGGGPVIVSTAPNPSPSGGRSDSIVIAGIVVSVSQGPGGG